MDVVSQVADSVTRLAPTGPGATLVTVDGPAGTGKTSFADDLRAALAARDLVAQVIHLDDLYDGWDGLDERLTDHLDSWVVQPLLQGVPPRHRVYDWYAERYTHWREVPACDVLIVEGVGAGQPVMSAVAAVRVWLEAPADVCRDRALARDGASTAAHWDAWTRRQDEMLARWGGRAAADVVVDTSARPEEQ